jgi:hypothetical protein
VSVVLEKGYQVSYTDPSPVDPENATAVFEQVMRQVRLNML